MKPVAAREIKVRLVNGHHFDDRGEFIECLEDPLRIVPVFLVAAAKKDGMRTELLRLLDRLRGVYAEFVRLIAGRRHHATSIRVGAHNHRLAFKRGILQLLH